MTIQPDRPRCACGKPIGYHLPDTVCPGRRRHRVKAWRKPNEDGAPMDVQVFRAWPQYSLPVSEWRRIYQGIDA